MVTLCREALLARSRLVTRHSPQEQIVVGRKLKREVVPMLQIQPPTRRPVTQIRQRWVVTAQGHHRLREVPAVQQVQRQAIDDSEIRNCKSLRFSTRPTRISIGRKQNEQL